MQIAAWDANVITAHRRMGNTGLSLKDLSLRCGDCEAQSKLCSMYV